MSNKTVNPSLFQYGCIPDKKDVRDFLFVPNRNITHPPSIDLVKFADIIYDQGDLGSCTGNGLAGGVEWLLVKEKKIRFTPSRLMIYYGERSIEDTISEDSGGMIRDGIKFISSKGVCNEKEWPYIINQFTVKPPKQCWIDSAKHIVGRYNRVTIDLDHIKNCLAQEYPIICGFPVYESFESDTVAKTGIMPIPDTTKEKQQGGHCVRIMNYNDAEEMFLVANSWGRDWGLNGYFKMPYGILNNPETTLSDAWQITLI